MKRYLRADKKHYIDLDTFTFVKESERKKPFNITVPFFLWDFNEQSIHSIATGFENINGTLQNQYSRFEKSNVIELNNMSVQFINGYAQVLVQFYDVKTASWKRIEITSNPIAGTVVKGGRRQVVMSGVDYVVQMDGENKILRDSFNAMPDDERRFRSVPYTRQQPAYNLGTYCYGIKNYPFKIYYKEHELNGRSYAFLLGSWCILLGDDMTFDSIAILENNTAAYLTVKKFIHTVNPYILKMMLLIK